MVSMKNLKKMLKSMKKLINTLTRGKRERPSKQELKDAKRRKLEERSSLISRESSLSEIIPVSDDNGSATALRSSQASWSNSDCPGSRGNNSIPQLDSDDFFVQILNETESSSNERAVSFDPLMNFDPFSESRENWNSFDGFTTFLESDQTTVSKLFEKNQLLNAAQLTAECNDPWSPSSLIAVESRDNSKEDDIFSCSAEEDERVFFSNSDNLVGMIPRYTGVMFLPNDIVKVSQAPQQLCETENQLLPVIILTPPNNIGDQPPQILFEGNIPTNQQVSQCTLVSSCNPLLNLSYKAFADKLSSQKILLESCVCLDSSTSLRGHIRVDNLGFEKNVFARVSRDTWSTASDIRAEYVSSTDGCTSDRFCFKLPANKPLEFALCYQVNGQTYWDNNNGRNYSVI